MRTANPAFKDKTFAGARAAAGEPAMSLQGTATKSLLLVLLTVFAAAFTWNAVATGNVGIVGPATLVGGLGGFIVALVTVFKPHLSPYTGPIYAVLEGLLLGGVSALYNARFAGLPLQAVLLTFGVFIALLVVYRTGIIRATENFRLGVVAATGGIMVMYLLSFVLGLLVTLVWLYLEMLRLLSKIQGRR